MPLTSVTAPTTPRTPTTAASRAGRVVAADRVDAGSRARLAPTAAGTEAPARVAAPTSCVLAAGGRPTERRTVDHAATRQPRPRTVTVNATPTARRRPLTWTPTSGSRSRPSPNGNRADSATAVMAAVTPPMATGQTVRHDEAGDEPGAVESDGA